MLNAFYLLKYFEYAILFKKKMEIHIFVLECK